MSDWAAITIEWLKNRTTLDRLIAAVAIVAIVAILAKFGVIEAMLGALR